MRLANLMLIPVLLPAQIQNLATTADGGQTYISTAYRQKGSDQAGYLKIFRIARRSRIPWLPSRY